MTSPDYQPQFVFGEKQQQPMVSTQIPLFESPKTTPKPAEV
jgi:hypothetical protein